MTIYELTVFVFVGSAAAGFLGALTGLGGGVVVVPMLTLLLGVDIRYAIGASLVSVIATSSGAAAAYVKEGISNIRVGMFLEIATTVGAIAGAYLAGVLPTNLIAVIFGLVLIFSVYVSSAVREGEKPSAPSKGATVLRMNGSYPTRSGTENYYVTNVSGGFGLMFVAGALSGLLGIGSGAAKVLAMDHVMRIPFKVSTTTSNFMIGVTAAASAGIYLHRGYIDPGLSMPVMLGVLLGSVAGTHVLVRAPTKTLRLVFNIVILIMAIEMILNGFARRV